MSGVGYDPKALNYYKKVQKHHFDMKRRYFSNPNPGRYKYKYKYRKTSRSGRNYWIYLYYTPYGQYKRNARGRKKRMRRKLKGRIKKYKDRWMNMKKVRKKTVDLLLSKLSGPQKTRLRKLLAVKKRGGKKKKSLKKAPARKLGPKLNKRKVKKKPAIKPSGYDSNATITDIDAPVSSRTRSRAKNKSSSKVITIKRRGRPRKKTKKKTKKRRLGSKKLN